jgi:hypothetical protein
MFDTVLRDTRPSTDEGENVPSNSVVTAVPILRRLVHSTRTPLDEIFNIVASAP